MILAAGALAVGLLLLILYVSNPAGNRWFPPCPFRYATGLYCPGCGALRCTHSLLNGDLSRAMALHPLLVVSLPFLAALVLRPSWAHRPWVPWFAFTVLILYGILRNIPVWPFSWLAPG
jgi:hypothetical protein